MAYIKTVPEDEAGGLLAEIYAGERKNLEYIPSYVRVMSLRPEAIAAWRGLLSSIRGNMRLRAYELVTIAAALVVKCRYWLLAHGAVLRKNGFTAVQVAAIIRNYRSVGLEPSEVAMMEYAQKITANAACVEKEDIEQLHQHGFSDEQILDIAMTAAARNFFSKLLDGLGAEPDSIYGALDSEVLKAVEEALVPLQ